MGAVPTKIVGEYLLLTVQRVGKLVADGVLKRTKRGFDLKASVNAYIRFLRSQRGASTKDYDSARTERMRGTAALVQLELKEKCGELLPLASVEQVLIRAIPNDAKNERFSPLFYL